MLVLKKMYTVLNEIKKMQMLFNNNKRISFADLKRQT